MDDTLPPDGKLELAPRQIGLVHHTAPDTRSSGFDLGGDGDHHLVASLSGRVKKHRTGETLPSSLFTLAFGDVRHVASVTDEPDHYRRTDKIL
jgi:hypothetical protein